MAGLLPQDAAADKMEPSAPITLGGDWERTALSPPKGLNGRIPRSFGPVNDAGFLRDSSSTIAALAGIRRSNRMSVCKPAFHRVTLFKEVRRCSARFCQASLFALCLVALCRTSLSPAAADDIVFYELNHVYIAYTDDYQPSAQGTLYDVTSDIVHDTQGHVYDLFGNMFTVNSADNSLVDWTGAVTGFVYAPVISPTQLPPGAQTE